jgi:hypothetical protein
VFLPPVSSANVHDDTALTLSHCPTHHSYDTALSHCPAHHSYDTALPHSPVTITSASRTGAWWGESLEWC